MPIIGESQIQHIKSAADIVDLISTEVNLKPSGKYLKGLCPFHKEKTPSFFIDPTRQTYRCYGCGKHGDIYSYLMDKHHLPFVDSVKKIASSAGITIVYEQQDPEEISHRENLFKANKIVADFYHYQLTKTDDGRKTLEYFHKREITNKTINTFLLGLAPNNWDTLYKYLPSTGIPVEIFEELGLIMPNKRGGFYDRFRNRAIFTILNHQGNTVGFGARRLKEEEQPKYLNSPDSIVYHKKEILYGLFYAAEAIRKEGFAIFVEGYMDFLRLFQEGIKNVVATSGTALTSEQAKLIKRYANTVYMCYDSDEAGIKSTVKSAKVLLPFGIDLKMIVLPKGQDPDSIILNKGKNAFLHYLGEAPEFSDYLLRYYRSKSEYETPKGKTLASRHVLTLIALIPDRLKQDFYIQDLSRKMQIDEDLMKAELQRQMDLLQHEMKLETRRAEKKMLTESRDSSLIESKNSVFYGDYESEKQMIFFLLQIDDIPEMKNLLYRLSLEHFQNEDTKSAIHDIFAEIEDTGNIDVLTLEQKYESFFNANKGKIQYINEVVNSEDGTMEKFATDVYNKLEIVYLNNKLTKLEKQINQSDPDSSEYRALQKEKMKVFRNIEKLK